MIPHIQKIHLLFQLMGEGFRLSSHMADGAVNRDSQTGVVKLGVFNKNRNLSKYGQIV